MRWPLHSVALVILTTLVQSVLATTPDGRLRKPAVLGLSAEAVRHNVTWQFGVNAEEQSTKASTPAWHMKDVPNPYSEPAKCGLTGPGWLCDADSLLTPTGRAKVLDIMTSINKKTRVQCPGGQQSYQVAAAIVWKMHGDDWAWPGFGVASKVQTAEMFSEAILKRWGVGQAGCDDGLLLFVSIGDRFAYLKTGKKTLQVLSFQEAFQIIEHMKPLLQEGKYDDALQKGFLHISDALQGKSVPWSQESRLDLLVFAGIGFLILAYCAPSLAMCCCGLLTAILMPFASCLDWCRHRKAPKELDAGRNLQRVQDELRHDEYDQSICPICFESLDADGNNDAIRLRCRHMYHEACIQTTHSGEHACPMCRSDADVMICEDDECRPDAYQRRLRNYLELLRERHPETFTTRNSSAYYHNRNTGSYTFYHLPHDTTNHEANAASSVTLVESLNAHHAAVVVKTNGWADSRKKYLAR